MCLSSWSVLEGCGTFRRWFLWRRSATGAGLDALKTSLKSCPPSASRMQIQPSSHHSLLSCLPCHNGCNPSNYKHREILLPLGSFVSHGLPRQQEKNPRQYPESGGSRRQSKKSKAHRGLSICKGAEGVPSEMFLGPMERGWKSPMLPVCQVLFSALRIRK